MDNAIGVHIIDRWTYYALEFLEKVTPGSKSTLKHFVSLSKSISKSQQQNVYTNMYVVVGCSLATLILKRLNLIPR